MSTQRFPQQVTPRPPLVSSADEAARLAQALYRAQLVAPPKRCALMTAAGERKYSDAPKGHSFSVEDMADHLVGKRTWATTLADSAGLAVTGCRDYDAGGEAVIVAALEAASTMGLVAFGIVLEGDEAAGEHSGGHVRTLYRTAAPAADIRAQLRALPGAKGEIYPSGNCVRLLGGLHRRKSTRGVLLLQDGRRFNFDDPAELVAGLRVILALKRNPAPTPAPAEANRTSAGGSFGEHFKAADFENLPDGAALMASPRYQALFTLRPQLATLARWERVVLKRDGALDDSDSAQVAALVCNLLTTGRKDAEGRMVPGLGAPPLDEVRAVGLHWKPALRDGRTLEHYTAQIAYEIARYTPPDYAPEATGYIPQQQAAAPRALQPARYGGAGRPAGQCAEQGQRLVALVAALPADAEGWRETTRTQLADALGCKERMASTYLAHERSVHLETRQTKRGLKIRLIHEGGNDGPQKPDETRTPQRANRHGQAGSTEPGGTDARPGNTHRNPAHPSLPPEALGADEHPGHRADVENPDASGTRGAGRICIEGGRPATMGEPSNALRVAINSEIKACNRPSNEAVASHPPCMEKHSARAASPVPVPASSTAVVVAGIEGAAQAEPLGAPSTGEGLLGGRGCFSKSRAHAAGPLQDIDVSRERGTRTEQRMASVYRWQGEQVRIIPREEQRNGRGDLECTRPDGSTVYREIKGEREYRGRCAAIEVATVPLNPVAYGGPSGPAESKADTFVYMNTTTGAWWELEVATVRALLPQWQQQHRTVDGKVNERDTPYGHARYHARLVLVPQAELARHAISTGIAPDLLAEAVRVAYDTVSSVELVNEQTGELRRQRVTIGAVLAALAAVSHTFAEADVTAALKAEREARKHAALLASIAELERDGLRAMLRLADRKMEQSKDEGTGAHRFWWVVAQRCKGRMATLQPESQQQKAARKRGGEAKPSPRRVGEAEQAQLWDVANEALDELRASRTPERRADVRNEAYEFSDATTAPIAPEIAGEVPLHLRFTPAEYAEAARTMSERMRQRLASAA